MWLDLGIRVGPGGAACPRFRAAATPTSVRSHDLLARWLQRLADHAAELLWSPGEIQLIIPPN